MSYLSFVGYPLYSNNIAAWNTGNFLLRPVSYATKENGADCRHLAFHPKLPIAAAPANNVGAVCFDRETGAVEKDRLQLPGSFDGINVSDLKFSPDGANLILVCEQNGNHFLVKAAVHLSAGDAAKVKKPVPPPPPPPAEPDGTTHLKT